jgi:hypothetical protein
VRRFLLILLLFLAAVYLYLVAAVNDDNRWFREFSKSVNDSNRVGSATRVFRSKPLLNALDALITRQDSLANANPIHPRHRSFWVSFYADKGQCYVSLVANFSFYSSQTIKGYLHYRDKIISFYDKEPCSNDLVDWQILKKGNIAGLTDYDHADGNDSIALTIPPPPPPHEPFRRTYLVVSKDSLPLVFEGY